jgi:hypothetical protein
VALEDKRQLQLEAAKQRAFAAEQMKLRRSAMLGGTEAPQRAGVGSDTNGPGEASVRAELSAMLRKQGQQASRSGLAKSPRPEPGAAHQPTETGTLAGARKMKSLRRLKKAQKAVILSTDQWGWAR